VKDALFPSPTLYSHQKDAGRTPSLDLTVGELSKVC
jgi:hypothetical protein